MFTYIVILLPIGPLPVVPGFTVIETDWAFIWKLNNPKREIAKC